MGRNQLTYMLLLSVVSLAYADKIYGKCPLATQIFETKSSRESTTEISQEYMCPNVEKNCCDEDTYKSMNIWWDDSGEMSMNRIWLKKVETMISEMKLQKEVYFPKIEAFLESQKSKTFGDIECKVAVRNAQMLHKIKAYQQFFETYPKTSGKCWQYTINFLRGTMCAVCDQSSTYYFSEKMFAIDSTECWRYMDACQFQLKATVVFLNYVKSFAALGSCKLKGIVEDDAEKPYIYFHDQNVVDLCLQNKHSNFCKSTCEMYMPWTGITYMEQLHFDDINRLIFQIKHYFPDAQYTQAADETVDTWDTSKDTSLINILNKPLIRDNAFNITKFYDPKAAGLSLERLGFIDLKEFIAKENKVHYYAAIISISWLACLLAMATLN